MDLLRIREFLSNGSGSGSGSGYGNGYGNGSGSGYGNGYGNGSGSGNGIKSINGMDVYKVDDVPTIFTHIHGNVAKGYILERNVELKPCYVVKGNGYFAHGETLKEARDALVAKYFEDMDEEETIEKFLETFKKGEKYAGTEFFEWHHYLTGSCLMGRESFIKNKGLDINSLYTVDEFIFLCENDYGSSVIKNLKERWENI